MQTLLGQILCSVDEIEWLTQFKTLLYEKKTQSIYFPQFYVEISE